MFTDFMFDNQAQRRAFDERLDALTGKCPMSRICSDRDDMAAWIKSFATAAGVVARSGKRSAN